MKRTLQFLILQTCVGGCVQVNLLQIETTNENSFIFGAYVVTSCVHVYRIRNRVLWFYLENRNLIFTAAFISFLSNSKQNLTTILHIVNYIENSSKIILKTFKRLNRQHISFVRMVASFFSSIFRVPQKIHMGKF